MSKIFFSENQCSHKLVARHPVGLIPYTRSPFGTKVNCIGWIVSELSAKKVMMSSKSKFPR